MFVDCNAAQTRYITESSFFLNYDDEMLLWILDENVLAFACERKTLTGLSAAF